MFSGSDRMHDVAYSVGSSHGASPARKQPSSARRYPKSALQKLLSMVEPIMHPLRNEQHDSEKDEVG